MAVNPDSNAARRKANTQKLAIASARRDSATLGESLGAERDSIKKVQASISKRGTGIGPINNTQSETIKALKAANRLNPSGKTMGEIARTVAQRVSGLQGRGGQLGGQHAGGQGIALGGLESNSGGGGAENMQNR